MALTLEPIRSRCTAFVNGRDRADARPRFTPSTPWSGAAVLALSDNVVLLIAVRPRGLDNLTHAN